MTTPNESLRLPIVFVLSLIFLIIPISMKYSSKTLAYDPDVGPYPVCRNTGYACESDGQCCSGHCINRQCVTQNSCIINGASCSTSTGLPCCTGGSCQNGTCKADGEQKCTPFAQVPRPNIPCFCSSTCNQFGTGWMINPTDCTSCASTTHTVCAANGDVYWEGNSGERKFIESCGGSSLCLGGICVKPEGGRCTPGAITYNSDHVGQCLNICGADGKYHLQHNCGNVNHANGILESENVQLLLASSYFYDFMLVDVVGISDTFIINDFTNHTPIPGIYNPDFWGGEFYGQDYHYILLPDYGRNDIYTMIHEFTHNVAEYNPALFEDYKQRTGCRQSDTNNETYVFTHEQPVTDYGSTNCDEAIAEASEKYFYDPCPMQTAFPIQYEFVKTNILPYAPGCTELGTVNQSNIAMRGPARKPIQSRPIKSLQASYPPTDNRTGNYDETDVMGVQVDGKLVKAIGLGMTQTELKTVLGNPTRVSQENTYTNYLYEIGGSNVIGRYVFDAAGHLVYFRVGQDSLKSAFRSLASWVTTFGNPQALYQTSVESYSHRLLYTNKGFTIVVKNSSKSVLQYESFTPMSLHDYTQSWGAAVQFDAISYKRADTTADGNVDIFDYNLLLGNFGATTASISDINHDQRTDIFDYNILLSDFGK